MDHHDAVFRLVMLGVVPTADAAAVLVALQRAVPAPSRRRAADPDKPFAGAQWNASRRVAYAIGWAASSGAPAPLPMRPLRPPSRRHIEAMPSPRKRMKSGGKR